MIDWRIRPCSYCRNALIVNFVTVDPNEQIFTKCLKWVVLETRNSRLNLFQLSLTLKSVHATKLTPLPRVILLLRDSRRNRCGNSIIGKVLRAICAASRSLFLSVFVFQPFSLAAFLSIMNAALHVRPTIKLNNVGNASRRPRRGRKLYCSD